MAKIHKYTDYDLVSRSQVDPTTALANSDGLLIGRGAIRGASVVHKFGRNPDVPNGTWEGVLQAAAQFPWLTAAIEVRIKASGDENDDGTSSPLGTGAWSVTIQGLDATGAFVQETVATKGASASEPTTTKFLRVFRAWVATAGAYGGSNTAAIVIETTGGTALIQITAAESQTQFCGYTIPLGKVAYLVSVMVQCDAAKAADFRLFTRANCTTTTAPFTAKRLKYYWDGVFGQVLVKPVTPLLVLPALTDIWIEASGGGAGTEVAANMELIVFDA